MPGRLRSLLRSLTITAAARLSAAAITVHEWLVSPSRRAVLLGGAALAGLLFNPPVRTVAPGEVALRTSRLSGEVRLFREGAALVMPLVHELRLLSLRDQLLRLTASESARGAAPFQSVEGLPLGIAVTARWALDPEQVLASARRLPPDVGQDLVAPVVDSVLRRAVARSTVREIFSARRLELQDAAEAEVAARLGPEGVKLRALALGAVDLPPDYRAGMEAMLQEELASEKMRVTLALKQQRVRETELEGDSEKAKRAKQAEAAAQEELIAAKAHAEAMQHVLPFKQKEIEQRRLEAEARGVQRTKDAEADAAARRIEVSAEVEVRRKLAEADAYRVEAIGRAQSELYARDAEVLTKNPLLVQKAFAEKLSEKLQIVVAPPSAGGFFAAGLLGMQPQAPQRPAAVAARGPAPSPPPGRAGERDADERGEGEVAGAEGGR